jgi:hypothetical protein
LALAIRSLSWFYRFADAREIPVQLKDHIKIAAKIAITFVLLVLAGGLVFLWQTGYFLPAMTEDQARKLIEKAGGAEQVNQDARKIFTAHGTNELYSLWLYEGEITNYPAIASLLSNSASKSFTVLSRPPQITILYGPHSHLRLMHIFEATNDLPAKYESPLISSNIFFTDIPH